MTFEGPFQLERLCDSTGKPRPQLSPPPAVWRRGLGLLGRRRPLHCAPLAVAVATALSRPMAARARRAAANERRAGRREDCGARAAAAMKRQRCSAAPELGCLQAWAAECETLAGRWRVRRSPRPPVPPRGPGPSCPREAGPRCEAGYSACPLQAARGSAHGGAAAARQLRGAFGELLLRMRGEWRPCCDLPPAADPELGCAGHRRSQAASLGIPPFRVS